MVKLKTFLVEVTVFIGFVLIGAAVFQVLEQDEDDSLSAQSNSTDVLSGVLHQMQNKYNFTTGTLNETVEELRKSLRNPDGEPWQEWNFAGSYFFAGTIAFTIVRAITVVMVSSAGVLAPVVQRWISCKPWFRQNFGLKFLTSEGFGHQTPKTTLGKLTVMFYAMIAIPIAVIDAQRTSQRALLLASCGEKLAEQQQSVVIFIERKIFKRIPTYLKAKTIAMNVFVLILFMIISVIMIKYLYDGWTTLECIYFLWICLTTVGFGDYIINNGKPYYDGETLKTLMLRLNILFLVVGLCQVSCILVSIQDALATVRTNVAQGSQIEGDPGSSLDDMRVVEALEDDVLANDNKAFEADLQSIEREPNRE